MRLKLELDGETAEKLVEAAEAERRPTAWEAEVLLRRALGLPLTVVAHVDGRDDLEKMEEVHKQ